MKLIDRWTGRTPEERGLSWQDFAALLGGDPTLQQTYVSKPYGDMERPSQSFDSYADVARTNGVVFACMLVRLQLFSEARFIYRNFRKGRPGDLFSTAELDILERPDVGMTTGDLLARMEQDSSLAGNSYHVRLQSPVGDRLVRLRPNWVTIVMGSPHGPVENPEADPDARVIGYLYGPEGADGGENARVFTPDQVAHFAPIPDPIARFRGMSWLTPVLREIDADSQASAFKSQFFRNGATPNMVVTFDKEVKLEAFEKFKRVMEEEHVGTVNAFKTMYLGAGADAKVVGNSFEQMSFKAVQAAGETRIAAASGVPPLIVGLSEGLGAATYSNYSQARRALADRTARPWWRNAAASLETVVPTPSDAQLWYDDRDIPFLRDDARDVAEIAQMHAATVKALIEAGFDPDTSVKAVESGDFSQLVGNHVALPVQLRPAGETPAPGPKQTAKPDGANASPPDSQE